MVVKSYTADNWSESNAIIGLTMKSDIYVAYVLIYKLFIVDNMTV